MFYFIYLIKLSSGTGGFFTRAVVAFFAFSVVVVVVVVVLAGIVIAIAPLACENLWDPVLKMV